MVFEDIILTEILAEELDRLMTDEYVNAIQDKKILEQQNKKLTDEVKRLKEEINRLTTHAGCQGNPNCEWCKVRKKILGESDHEIVENLKKIECHVKKDGNQMYGIYGYNTTGGCEFSTHYGYADKERAIREFQSVFHFDVWDYETKKTYKFGELESIQESKA